MLAAYVSAMPAVEISLFLIPSSHTRSRLAHVAQGPTYAILACSGDPGRMTMTAPVKKSFFISSFTSHHQKFGSSVRNHPPNATKATLRQRGALVTARVVLGPAAQGRCVHQTRRYGHERKRNP